MADERAKIVNIKKQHGELLTRVGQLEAQFTQVGCRYRHELSGLCEHQRHGMQKYPGHKPKTPHCGLKICPRN